MKLSIEDAFRATFAESSPVRRRNQFTRVLDRLRFEPVLNPRLVRYLLDGLKIVKEHVAEQIAKEHLTRFGSAIVPRLRRGLDYRGDKSDGLRLTALVAIDPVLGRQLCAAALQEGSDIVRAHAMKALTELDAPRAEQVALELLAQQPGGLAFRNAALTALTGSSRDEALELLLAALPVQRLRWSAHFALKVSPHPRAAARLQTLLTEFLQEIAAQSVNQGGKRGMYLWHLMSLLVSRPEEEGLARVIRLMDHADETVRAHAATTVWHHVNDHDLVGKRCLPELTAALSYPDPRARDAAVNVLSCAGAAGTRAVPALIACMESDPDFGMRRRAAETLGRIGKPVKVVVAALVKALHDTSPWVRRQAVTSLGYLGGSARTAFGNVLTALGDADGNVTAEVPQAVYRIGGVRAALPVLTEALKHSHAGVRGSTANALGEIGPGARVAIPALTQLLTDPDGWVRWRAVDALGNMGGLAKNSVAALSALLAPSSEGGRSGWEHNHYTRISAAEALAKMGSAAQEAIPALTAWKRDKNKAVRAAVLRALTEVGQP